MAEVVLEVDVQPFTACASCFRGGHPDKLGAYAHQASFLCHQRVEDEGMTGAIPCDVDETYELLAISCAYPAETVPGDLTDPVVLENGMRKTLRMQCVDLDVVELPSPMVGDHQGKRRRSQRHSPGIIAACTGCGRAAG